MKKSFIFLLLLIFSICTMSKNEKTSNNSNSEMNSLGLIGGTSWHSTIEYYQTINSAINKHYGNNTNPPLIVYTVNQAEVHRLQKENKWDSISEILTSAALKLKNADAKAVMFCANTPHKVYDDVQQKLDIPVLHIADATAQAIQNKSIHKVGFIGTKYTMTESFITKRFSEKNIEVITPESLTVINELQRIIEEELTFGNTLDKSKKYIMSVLQSMVDKGAQGIVLGCTEFPLIISQEDFSIPVFNTSEIHSDAAVKFILGFKDD